jgi:uncharacterized protein YciI
MLILMHGIFKSGSGDAITALQQAFSQHLGQPLLRIHTAGALLNADGTRAGFMIVLESGSVEAARSYLETDPFLTAGLYERVDLLEYRVEAGRL